LVDKSKKPIFVVSLFLCVAMFAFYYFYPVLEFIFLSKYIYFILLFLAAMQIILSNGKITFIDTVYQIFALTFIATFMLSFVEIIFNSELGRYIICFVLSAAWGADCFGLIVGKTIGKHKFTKISPNKTIEGCIGGIFGALIFSALCVVVFSVAFGISFSLKYVLIFTLILSVFGEIGDLFLSAIKRQAGVKDFSNLIPGHGGILDRIDSVLFILPAAYILLTYFEYMRFF
jgi:phosphatidate cytidylyltransferase